jgi:ABC-type lipoprotein release transport system permease subunit
MNIILRLAWRNLWRQPRRTWLTVGAMVFSNALLVFMISIQFSTYELMIDNTLQAFTGHMQVQAPGYKDDLKMRQVVPDVTSLASSLRRELGLETIAARAAAFALASSEERTYGLQIYGVEPQFESFVSTIPGLIRDGRYLKDPNATEIVIGKVLARNLRVALGDEVTLLGSGRDGSFAAAIATVVGIFDSGVPDLDRSIAEVPLGFFQDVFYMEGAGHQVVIAAPDLTSVELLKPRVELLVPDELAVHDWDALQPGLKQAIQADLSSAFFMYAVLVVLVAFSVLNTQLMSVLERTHEFGITMSLGIAPGRLGRLVILETALMGLVGLGLGALIGGIVTEWFGYTGFSYPGMEEMAVNFNLPSRFYPQATALTLFLGPAIVFVGGMLAAVYPALRLHWLEPVEAMRAAP